MPIIPWYTPYPPVIKCGSSENPPWHDVPSYNHYFFHETMFDYERWIHYSTIIPRVSWLVVSTPLKNISQLGLFFPIYIYIYIWKNKKCSKPPTAIRLYFINHIINHDTKTISNIHRWFSPRITIYHTKIYRSNLGEPGWSSSLLQPKSCNAVSSHMSNNREKKPGEKKTYRMVEDVHRQCFHMFSL